MSTHKKKLIARTLFGGIGVLAVLHTSVWLFLATGDVSESLAVVHLFDMDSDQNIPTTFAVVLLLLLSFLCISCARREAQCHENNARFSFLLLCGFGALAVATDELFSFHERLIVPVGALLTDSAFWRHAWVLPILLLLGVALFISRVVWKHFPWKVKRLGAIGIAVFLVGAAGVEFLSGAYLALGGNILTYKLITMVEESLEMVGVVVLIIAAMEYQHTCHDRNNT